MRISRDVVVKAALGALIFGRDVEAQATPASNEASALPTTTARTEQSTPEPSNSSSALELLNTQHRWTIPADIRFNKPAEFKYALGYNSDLKKFETRLTLLLVQTSAKYPTPVTKENSWIVIQLLRKLDVDMFHLCIDSNQHVRTAYVAEDMYLTTKTSNRRMQ